MQLADKFKHVADVVQVQGKFRQVLVRRTRDRRGGV